MKVWAEKYGKQAEFLARNLIVRNFAPCLIWFWRDPVALLPTQAGCAVFLGDGQKSIVFISNRRLERPSMMRSPTGSLRGL